MDNDSPSTSPTPLLVQSARRTRVAAAAAVLVIAILFSTAFYAFKLAHRGIASLDIVDSIGELIQPSRNAPVPYQKALVEVPFTRQEITINPAISQPFSIAEIQNISDIEKEYGFTFTPAERASLEQNKFVIKNLLDTNITGKNGLEVQDYTREFIALYLKVSGDSDYKNRTPANAVFISSDVMMYLFSTLSVELLKETENTVLYDQLSTITKTLYEQASANLRDAQPPEERERWTAVRDYFAVPYALLSNSAKPMRADDYWNSDYYKQGKTRDELQADLNATDATIDEYENTAAFVKKLSLGAASEEAVLADLKQIYDAAQPRGAPAVFGAAWIAQPSSVTVTIPFTLFKPRGTYTSSSLRRQYFRTVQWYQQIPFLLGNREMTAYAVAIGEMMQAHPEILNRYDDFSSFIGYIIGESDDLDAGDYAAAVTDLGNDIRDHDALGAYLDKRQPESKIKAMPVFITAGTTATDIKRALKGMRFMSQKFIPDSYWTSKLTKGDEAPEAGELPLPDRASMLEVMSILGSPYATSRLSDLPFYETHKQGLDRRLAVLTAEADNWSDGYWRSNLYTGTLWSISGMFDWLTENRVSLPRFMQSPLWEAKTLLTSAGMWTELRHLAILYAKQSFAEMGGGGTDACDPRHVPEPPKGYVEPQPEAYDRLSYAARRMAAEYRARGYQLQNLSALDRYIELLDTVREYTKLELEDTGFAESTISKVRHSYDDDMDCTEYFISPESAVDRGGDYYDPKSHWEELRVNLVQRMAGALPIPVEGPIMQIKDKRSAVVADVHTDKNDKILEEGTGVPRVIFVAVKDSNGPRLTVGFTYSQYETISSERLTDEEWQERFYTDSGDYSITYKPKGAWPDINPWFQELLGIK